MNQNKSKKNSKRKKKQSSLPLFIMVGGGLLLIIAAVFAFQSSKSKATIEVTGAPSLKVDQEMVDLGNKKLGSLAQVSFLLTNVGNQPLQFSEAPYIEVKEGC